MKYVKVKELMEYILEKYNNISKTNISDITSEDSDEVIEQQLAIMKDPNIETELQEKWWEQYLDHQYRINDCYLDKQIGVNCEFGFQE